MNTNFPAYLNKIQHFFKRMSIVQKILIRKKNSVNNKQKTIIINKKILINLQQFDFCGIIFSKKI